MTLPTLPIDAAGEAPRAWLAAGAQQPPKRIVVADDATPADAAYKAACEGTALLWRGDYQNARQLLTALARRVDRTPAQRRSAVSVEPGSAQAAQLFHRQRQLAAQRSRVLGMLLIPVDPGFVVPLRRAPDVHAACAQALTPAAATAAAMVPLRDLLGFVGAYEWHRNGVAVAALGGDRIYPDYGVFAPTRNEYLDLLAQQPLPAAAQAPNAVAFDVGTGTGVLAAILARRGVPRVVATDCDPRALACAQSNCRQLGAVQVDVVAADLFPAGSAQLIVCNPPWLPAKPIGGVDHAVYDADSRMLRGFLDGLAAHLAPAGEGWLILSDLAELLGLRSRQQLLDWLAAAGLAVAGRADVRPRHKRAADADDPLYRLRAAEVTSLWRLTCASR